MTGEAPRRDGRVVLIEDDDTLRQSLVEYLQDKGFDVVAAADGPEGLAHIDDDTAVVVTDLKLPGMSGLDVLKQTKAQNSDVQVIVTTGHASVDTAVQAMREGAYHYVTKPINPTVLARLIEEVLEKRSLRREVRQLREQLGDKFGLDRMIGRSAVMQQIFDVIRHVAPTRATVFIMGESGTGKELVARSIHEHSTRRDRPFIAFNCAALPASLVESELFGHEKGAFTGAIQRRKGLLGAADGGTLFIDEVAELDVSLQAKLLRALEERAYVPLGSNTEVKVDVRFVAATNRDPAQAVREGKFREDLYYRLKVVTIALPPLRDRRDDIPLLSRSFLDAAITEHGLRQMTLDAEALRLLQLYDWPGNVRELKNTIESAAVLSRGDTIFAKDLPVQIAGERARTIVGAGTGMFTVGQTLADMEKAAILATLDAHGGNRTQAAKELGISLRTLQRKLKEYGLQPSPGVASEKM